MLFKTLHFERRRTCAANALVLRRISWVMIALCEFKRPLCMEV